MTEPASVARLERVIGGVLRAGVAVSSACFAAGLALSLLDAASGSATLLLHTGVIVLLATPVARVVVSVVEYLIQRDWMFVALTTIVLVELMASAILALVGFARS